ncbi:MAG TPA: outer membrane protein assembly factor BamD [Alphaproteobacteria bacterium]|nr:outer membrane protein assembly factor BamD [Rhodospirillaceae bacterium]HBD52605.1 outer membrane protein assembly factor BamD [Alphaproteobacteria bacterium]HBP58525.1 outer membrane protein assembly factor BamD [Alphaproteobacteria bacterium]HBP73344.1 outer membrane protein assembly factor BamD [Alphaproteobacteria bacterium]HCA14250.1 outer membrane protein assembly factor BamD [Alphaproteobacteria bacterium]
MNAFRRCPVANPLIPVIASAVLIGLAACSTPDIPEQVERPANELYDEALQLAKSGEPDKAAPKFEEVERQHPYSDLAVRAQIMAAWSFYQSNDYPRAVASLERFIELNPADPMVEYAHYLRALSYYEQIVNVERDAEMTMLALNAFEDLLRRFPDGEYGRDAQLKADLARSHLAGKEMAVGRFYAERGYHAAALRRFEKVVASYQTTNQVPEALYRMVEVYLALGLVDEADRVGSVAVYNYPDSFWTKELLALAQDPSRKLPKGMFERAIDSVAGLFDRE